MKAAIAVPSIREHSIKEFLSKWEEAFRPHTVIVVEDNPERSFALPDWVHHVSWKEIGEDLGDDAWIIPRRSGAIRNYGILLAGRTDADMIVMLDDDCLPDPDAEFRDGCPFLEAHWAALNEPGTVDPLFDTLFVEAGSIHARGFPKEARKARTVLNHGLWGNIPDLDGETQLRHPVTHLQWPSHSIQIPRGVLFPMSAMNVAFRPALLPAMYQMPMGEGQPFHRFDDIWCGWIMKRACDVLGWSVRSGSPAIHHARASDARRNAEVEAPGVLENEKVWRNVMDVRPAAGDLDSVLEHIHDSLSGLGQYWHRVGIAAKRWRHYVRAGRHEKVPA